MKTLYIGDIHGDFDWMEKVIDHFIDRFEKPDRIVQVGDFGYFPRWDFIAEYNRDYKFKDYGIPQWFIRGNHEDHVHLLGKYGGATDPAPVGYGPWKFIPDGFVRDSTLYIGGAFSIDKRARTDVHPAQDKWTTMEELNDIQFQNILDSVDESIETVVSHDCPRDVLPHIHGSKTFPTRTGRWLEKIREKIKPKQWIFGHHHKSLNFTIDGCTYNLLDTVSNRALDYKSVFMSYMDEKSFFHLGET